MSSASKERHDFKSEESILGQSRQGKGRTVTFHSKHSNTFALACDAIFKYFDECKQLPIIVESCLKTTTSSCVSCAILVSLTFPPPSTLPTKL